MRTFFSIAGRHHPPRSGRRWRRTMTLTRSMLRAAAIACVLGWAGATSAGEPAAYPTRPVKLIVAAAAGSTPDVLARLIAEQLSAALGQPVVVDDRGGAGQT